MDSFLNKKQLVLIAFVLVVAIFRLFPHLPNVTPITAMALFSGAYFSNKALAYIVPLAAMFLSDLILGFSGITLFVYAAFILVSFIGFISKKTNLKTILISSVSFFIITNFGVWLLGYPKTFDGLIECYTLAIPFFRNSLIGDFFFAGVLYYGFNFVSRKYLQTV
ncbi:DUF6580 family putative transport protein [Seonamhaeicola aphaedonensis]|uniref:Rod shape-determining protein MreD n=1 Tax=Seonamhaeicola aphaedonensis TaxID=1461338 RepID=A0A3D9H8X7_9FLAO|nr:DUF6580 family putative transport protein [Seonamhaeicola aphaedonensis]RED45928.1 hypothetical protein DFQ02_10774 [Seonamhaeicola aphaedonensis]